MADQDNQLVELPDGQLLFFGEAVDDQILQDRDYKQGNYTGERVKVNDPARYALICRLLAEGLPQRKVARMTRTCRNLVGGIAKMQGHDIEPLKKAIANDMRQVIKLCTERMQEILESDNVDVSFKDLGVVSGIFTERSQLLEGEATSIVSDLSGSSKRDELADYLNSLRTAQAEEMGFLGNYGEQKGGDDLGSDSDDDSAAGMVVGPPSPRTPLPPSKIGGCLIGNGEEVVENE